jgi:hypothetical protein
MSEKRRQRYAKKREQEKVVMLRIINATKNSVGKLDFNLVRIFVLR